jgi:hypothetical protein
MPSRFLPSIFLRLLAREKIVCTKLQTTKNTYNKRRAETTLSESRAMILQTFVRCERVKRLSGEVQDAPKKRKRRQTMRVRLLVLASCCIAGSRGQAMGQMPFYPTQFSILVLGTAEYGNWTAIKPSKTSSCWNFSETAFPPAESANISFSPQGLASTNASERSVVLRMDGFYMHPTSTYPVNYFDNYKHVNSITGVTVHITRRANYQGGSFGVADSSIWMRIWGPPLTSQFRNNSNPFSPVFETIKYGTTNDRWGIPGDVDIGGNYAYSLSELRLRLIFDAYGITSSLAELACIKLYVHFQLESSAPTTSPTLTPSSVPTSTPSLAFESPTSTPSLASESPTAALFSDSLIPSANPSFAPSSTPTIIFSPSSVATTLSGAGGSVSSSSITEFLSATLSFITPSSPVTTFSPTALGSIHGTTDTIVPQNGNQRSEPSSSAASASIALVAALCSTGLFCCVFCITTGLLLCLYQRRRKEKRHIVRTANDGRPRQPGGWEKFTNRVLDRMEVLGGRADPSFDSSESYGVPDEEKIRMRPVNSAFAPQARYGSTVASSRPSTPVSPQQQNNYTAVPTRDYVHPPPPLQQQPEQDSYQPLPYNPALQATKMNSPLTPLPAPLLPSNLLQSSSHYDNVSQIGLFSNRSGDSEYERVHLSEKPRHSLNLHAGGESMQVVDTSTPMLPPLPPTLLHQQSNRPPPIPAQTSSNLPPVGSEGDGKNYYATSDLVAPTRPRRASSTARRTKAGGSKKTNQYDGMDDSFTLPLNSVA